MNSEPTRKKSPSGHAVDDVRELKQLCRSGRLYDVEAWIRDGKPMQLPPEAQRGGARASFDDYAAGYVVKVIVGPPRWSWLGSTDLLNNLNRRLRRHWSD